METIKQVVDQATVFQRIYLSDLPLSQKVYLLIGSNISSDFEELYDILDVEVPEISEDDDNDLQFLDYVNECITTYLSVWRDVGEIEEDDNA